MGVPMETNPVDQHSDLQEAVAYDTYLKTDACTATSIRLQAVVYPDPLLLS